MSSFDELTHMLGKMRSRRDTLKLLGSWAAGGLLLSLGVGCGTQRKDDLAILEPQTSHCNDNDPINLDKCKTFNNVVVGTCQDFVSAILSPGVKSIINGVDQGCSCDAGGVTQPVYNAVITSKSVVSKPVKVKGLGWCVSQTVDVKFVGTAHQSYIDWTPDCCDEKCVAEYQRYKAELKSHEDIHALQITEIANAETAAWQPLFTVCDKKKAALTPTAVVPKLESQWIAAAEASKVNCNLNYTTQAAILDADPNYAVPSMKCSECSGSQDVCKTCKGGVCVDKCSSSQICNADGTCSNKCLDGVCPPEPYYCYGVYTDEFGKHPVCCLPGPAACTCPSGYANCPGTGMCYKGGC